MASTRVLDQAASYEARSASIMVLDQTPGGATMDDLAVVIGGLGFVEAPRWHQGRLFFSDFYARTVLCVDPSGSVARQMYVPGQPSGLGFGPDGALLVVSTHDGHILRHHGGVTTVIADIGAMYRGRLNDMVVDEVGGCYVSTLPAPVVGLHASSASPDVRPDLSGPLFYVDPEGNARVVAEDLRMPNGMAVTADGKRLIVAETHGCALTVFEIGHHGALSNRALFADLGTLKPDGICLDEQGDAWVGCPFSEQFIHVREGGSVLDVVPTHGRWAVACALGGDDGRDLYCATVSLTIEDFFEGRGHGAIERVRVGVPAARTRGASGTGRKNPS